MSDQQDFYRAFEDKYRGSRESIKKRLDVYRPFVTPLTGENERARAVDLGCGRGEWLELLGDIGFDAVGVDLSSGMLEAAKSRGLVVELEDAISFLERQSKASISIVSGFHIAEHLPFDVLQRLVELAHQVLRPGGLLILETPNPENVSVGANSFYMDPTHERPIPPELLSFLPEYYGFHRSCVLRLQEQDKLAEGLSPITLLDVFQGVSPDYAVVSQKKADEDVLAVLNDAFSENRGLTLASLAERYDDQFRLELDQTAELVRRSADEAERALNEVARVAERAEIAAESAAARAGEVEIRAGLAEAELAEVYGSRSWQITRPLRWISFQISLLRKLGPKSRGKALILKFVAPIVDLLLAFISSRPGLRRRCANLAQRLGIYSRARSLYHGGGFFKSSGSYSDSNRSAQPVQDSLEELTPHARKAYYRLRSAIDESRKQA